MITLPICIRNLLTSFIFFLKILFIYFWRERETSMCERCTNWLLSHAPNWGPGQWPRHVSWLGIEPEIFWFVGRHSIHWATPARAWPPFSDSQQPHNPWRGMPKDVTAPPLRSKSFPKSCLCLMMPLLSTTCVWFSKMSRSLMFFSFGKVKGPTQRLEPHWS